MRGTFVCDGVFVAARAAVGYLSTHQRELGDAAAISRIPGTFPAFPNNTSSSPSPQVLLVLVRIEPYFLIAFVITYGLINVHFAEPEFGLTMALVPALLIQVAMTIVFTKTENTIGALAAIVSSTSSGMP
jgi:hypothetical protein